MVQESNRLTQFLLPVDGSPHSEKAVTFAGCIARVMKGRTKRLTLIHVLAGTYLKEHLEKRADVRAREVIESGIMRQLREEHIEKEVRPFIEREINRLRAMGVDQEIDYVIEDGRPAEKIMEVAQGRGYSTVIIGRRGLSAMKEFIVGSVTISLINQPGHPTVYIVSEAPISDDVCPIPRVLIPLDGSDHGRAALEEALIFLKYFTDEILEVDLLRVIDPARYEERRSQGIVPEEEGRAILDEAKRMVVAQGVPEERVDTLMLYGKPADRILDMAQSRNSNIIFMGKRGRSPLKDLIIGSTVTEVIHRLTSAIIVVAS